MKNDDNVKAEVREWFWERSGKTVHRQFWKNSFRVDVNNCRNIYVKKVKKCIKLSIFCLFRKIIFIIIIIDGGVVWLIESSCRRADVFE